MQKLKFKSLIAKIAPQLGLKGTVPQKCNRSATVPHALQLIPLKFDSMATLLIPLY